MTRLRKLGAREYPRFEREIIRFYAEQSAKAGRVSQEGALEWATKEVQEDLEYGVETADHWLYVIENDKPRKSAGYIWHGIDDEHENWAFLYSIVVFEQFRNKRIGVQAMQLLEDRLKKEGFEGMSLHVYAYNNIARKMYRNLGYETSALTIGKNFP